MPRAVLDGERSERQSVQRLIHVVDTVLMPAVNTRRIPNPSPPERERRAGRPARFFVDANRLQVSN